MSVARGSTSAAAAVGSVTRMTPATGTACSPLYPVLRGEVARYGELVGACYAALEEDPSLPRYMKCKYGKLRMLEDAGAGYEVTRYIYSSPPCRAWRRRTADAPAGLGAPPCRGDGGGGDVKVESGFLNIYTSANETRRFGCANSCRDQLLREVSRLVASLSSGEDVSVTLAGHSMGSALALLLAYDLVELGIASGAAAAAWVGNTTFKARCDELGVKVLRMAKGKAAAVEKEGTAVSDTSLIGVASSDSSTGELVVGEGGAFSENDIQNGEKGENGKRRWALSPACRGRSRTPATGTACSPLYPVLRGEVARYGELVGACYAALEEDPSLPRYMKCKYGKLRMLEDAGAGYEVTRYIYSSPPCRAWRRRTADAPAGLGTLRCPPKR
uniref:Fungal lipase-type domain-containing protein n=1 Tax=Oryza barthii TaxID=65489 RepID=A0A0D3HLP5_9ORYZ